jgi:hypothetical protein
VERAVMKLKVIVTGNKVVARTFNQCWQIIILDILIYGNQLKNFLQRMTATAVINTNDRNTRKAHRRW